MMKLTKDAYRQGIEQNINLLRKHMPRTLERDHIETVLEWSIGALYPVADPTLDLTGTVTKVSDFKEEDIARFPPEYGDVWMTQRGQNVVFSGLRNNRGYYMEIDSPNSGGWLESLIDGKLVFVKRGPGNQYLTKVKPPLYILNGRSICSYLHGKGDSLMICTRDPHDDGPCAMTPFDSLVSGLKSNPNG